MIGCDIVEISRIKDSVSKFGDKFIRKILTSKETELYKSRGEKLEFLAGRFAAKEAVVKALGTGLIDGAWFTNIEILNDESGKPLVYFNGGRREDVEISISHSRDNAIAMCYIKGEK